MFSLRQLDAVDVVVTGRERSSGVDVLAVGPDGCAAVLLGHLSENDDTVAYAEVADEDRGVAIGEDGRNIAAARTLAARHFDVDDVELT